MNESKLYLRGGNNMKFNNQTYDTIKWIVQVIMPALITFIGTVGTATGWPHTEITMTILGALTAFLGSSLGLSSANYYKEENNNESVSN